MPPGRIARGSGGTGGRIFDWGSGSRGRGSAEAIQSALSTDLAGNGVGAGLYADALFEVIPSYLHGGKVCVTGGADGGRDMGTLGVGELMGLTFVIVETT